jgi:hypothetical protein
MNFIGWFKVSSDIFLSFAILICVGKEEFKQGQYEDCLPNSLDI